MPTYNMGIKFAIIFDSLDGLCVFERMAYSLALREGKTKALGIKLLLFHPAFVGKTFLISSLVGDLYHEERATEGAELSILNATNWTKVTADQVLHWLQEKSLRDLKDSAKSHTDGATGENTAERYPELLPKTSTAKHIFFRKALNFISPKARDLPLKFPATMLDTDEIKRAIKAESIDLGDEDGIDVTILDFAGQTMYHTTLIRKDNLIMVFLMLFNRCPAMIKLNPTH